MPATSAALPSSLSLNSFFNEEFSAIGTWSGAFSIEDGAAKVPNATTIQQSATFPASGDWILYLKIKSTHTSDFYGYLAIKEGANPSLLNIAIDYDWADGVGELGTISASIDGGAIKKTLLIGADTSNDIELAVQFDSKFNVFNFFTRNGSTYTYIDSAAAPAITGAKNLQFYATNNGSGDRFLYVDYVTLAYPNIIAIGDSITAGHPAFDPNSDYYAGKDPYGHSYEAHIHAYEGDRNTLVVNKGVGSQNSSMINARIASDVVAHHPQIAILQASDNDYGAGFTQAQRTTNIQSSINTLHDAGIGVILTNAIVGQGVSASYYQTWNADSFGSMENVDVYADIMTSIANEEGQIADAYRDDVIHPNAAGHALIGAAIASAIVDSPREASDIKTAASVNPSEISTGTPMLSAEYDDPNEADSASYYQVQVIEENGSWSSPLWDSGKTVTSILEGNRQEVAYGGTSLFLNGKKYYQRWKFWDQEGHIGEWSDGNSYWIMQHNIQALGRWTHRKEITIDSSHIRESLGNFPVLINMVDLDLVNEVRDDGSDILFTSSDINWSTGTENDRLNHEIESCDSDTGALVAWVNIPMISSENDTKIYMYYGNTAVDNLQNAEAVWDDNYKMVQHIHGKTGSNIIDSTLNDNDASVSGSPVFAAGKIGNGASLNGSTDYFRVYQPASMNDNTGIFTMEAWVRVGELATSGEIMGIYEGNAKYEILAVLSSGIPIFYSGKNTYASAGSAYNDSQWHHLVGVSTGKNSPAYLYIDGDLVSTWTSGSVFSGVQSLFIGKRSPNTNYLKGEIDEVRVSDSARSAGWISAEFDNLNSPQMFYAVGEEESMLMDHFKLSSGETEVEVGGSVLVDLEAVSNQNGTHVLYDGDKSIMFTGSGYGGSQMPTFTDKNGNKINFGQHGTVSFAGGIATTSLNFPLAGIVSTHITDGTYDSSSALRMRVYSNGAPFTPPTKPSVSTLTITALDDSTLSFDHLPATITQIAISTTPDFTDSSWEDIDKKEELLKQYASSDTLYIKFRTQEGGVSDVITYQGGKIIDAGNEEGTFPDETDDGNIGTDASASTLNDGDIVKSPDSPDIYILKLKNGKRYKRLIIAPYIFNLYHHFSWGDIKTISQTELDGYTTSNLIREAMDTIIYELSLDNDTGKKKPLDPSTQYDPDSIFEINKPEGESYGLEA